MSAIPSIEKAQLKHMFQTMAVSGDRDTSLGMYKAFRAGIRNISITKRDVEAWLRTTGIELITVDIYKSYKDKVYCVYVQLPREWIWSNNSQRTVPHMIESTSYAECMYKLAFKVIAYKWDMTLSQIHEVEAWSFPKASRISK